MDWTDTGHVYFDSAEELEILLAERELGDRNKARQQCGYVDHDDDRWFGWEFANLECFEE